MDAQTAVYVTVVDENGCVDTDVVRVIMRRESIVLVPTGFSPNGDGNNDILFAHGSDHLRILSLSIFDRWGELLFQKGGDFALNDSELHWDGTFNGTDMPAGSYLWGIEILYPDGKVEVFEGSTSLIR
jgi:gliding motility-associated-like protein